MNSHTYLACALLLTSAAVSTTQAQIVLPNAAAGTEGHTAVAYLTSGAATMQFQINQNQLTSLSPGDQITGVSFRLNAAMPTGPSTDIDYTQFTIKLAQAANGNMSGTTPAQNMVNPQTVRSGPLTIGANTMPGGPGPNAWGPTIAFDDSYTYQGGNLVVYLTYDGQTGGLITLDGIQSAMGFGTDIFGKTAGGYEATSFEGSGFMAMQLQFNSVPEPHEYGMVAGLGLMGFAVWRRHRRVATTPSA